MNHIVEGGPFRIGDGVNENMGDMFIEQTVTESVRTSNTIFVRFNAAGSYFTTQYTGNATMRIDLIGPKELRFSYRIGMITLGRIPPASWSIAENGVLSR